MGCSPFFMEARMQRVRIWGMAALALALASCGGGETPQPGAPARSETVALNDAADMLPKDAAATAAGPHNGQ